MGVWIWYLSAALFTALVVGAVFYAAVAWHREPSGRSVLATRRIPRLRERRRADYPLV